MNRKSERTGKRKKKSSGIPAGVIAGVLGLAAVGAVVVVASQFLTNRPAATDASTPATNSAGAPPANAGATTPSTDAGAPNIAATQGSAAEVVVEASTPVQTSPGAAATPLPTAAPASAATPPDDQFVLNPEPTPEMKAMVKRGFIDQNSFNRKLTNERVGTWESLKVDFSDADIPMLEPFPNVKILSLPGGKVTDKGVEKIVAMYPGMRKLNLEYTQVTDKGIQAIASLNELTALYLSGTAITDRSLKTIGESFPNLETLWLKETRVTDKGLKQLGGLTKLKYVLAFKTKLTPSGIASLNQDLPECKVDIGKSR